MYMITDVLDIIGYLLVVRIAVSSFFQNEYKSIIVK